MNSDDRTGPPLWSTTSPEHLDRLARGVLRAAVDAFRELRQDPPEPDRRASALGLLARRTQEMLAPGLLPDHPPVGAEAQEGFVRTALALAVHVRAHSWAKADLGAVGAPGRDDVPHAGELWSADTFDVFGRLLLPNASSAGWTAALVTDVVRGDQELEAAVKLGKYVLHPTFLALADDTTRVIGEAVHNINVDRLRELAQLLRHHAGAAEPPDLTAKQVSRNIDQDPGPLIDSEAFQAVMPPLDDADRRDEVRGPIVDTPTIQGRRVRGFGL